MNHIILSQLAYLEGLNHSGKAGVDANYMEQIRHGNPQFPMSIHYTYIEANHTLALYHHKHKELELFFLLSGNISMLLDGHRQILNAGEAVLIQPHVLHGAFKNTMTSASFIAMTIQEDFVASHFNDGIQGKYITPLFRKDSAISSNYSKSVCNNLDLFPLMEQICVGYIQQSVGYELWVKGKTLELLHGFLKPLLPFQMTGRTEQIEPAFNLKLVIEFIEDHYQEAIKIQTLAHLLNISEGHFARLFKKHAGTTVIQYINTYRLNMAAHQLRNESIAIAYVAESTGFLNLSYFTRAFKKAFGITPKAYRKQNREASNTH